MMGPKQEAQGSLFYEFSLEDHVPQDHLLRSIDRHLDLSSIRGHLANFYSHTGRPSIDPELLIRMLLAGYCFGIRSERRLCEEVHLNLAYRWFCHLDLSDRIPDHSTFSKNRHGRFRESDLLRHVFETTVARCIEEGLVGGEGFAVDASLISADVQKQNSSNPQDWAAREVTAADAPRAVREYLDVLDDAAFGGASETTPKFTAHADPASQWTAARKGPAFFAYSDNYLIDTDHGIIMDVDVSRSIRQAEVGAMRKMIDRTEDRFGLKPDWVAADTAYGSSDNLVWLTLKRKILPFIPVFDHSKRKDGTWSRSDFTWDEDNDRYICPEGKELRHTRRNYSDPKRHKAKAGRRQYRSLKLDCQTCPSKPKCCPNTATRSVNREEYEIVRDFARLCTASDFNPTAQRRRKKVEMLFAHLKRILGLARVRLRGPCGVQDEFTLAATAQNLRKLAKLKPMVPATG
ncbi:transposase [Sulfitobacter sp. SK011]|uniref:transposase n=1 Tax=Sulfitobacter sp. SK011 TaxID=1389004 RepID=UPI000E0B5F0B|nr:transposase [Sulfitobacter sp. SK011]AXI41418.1 IS5/IS1182 family transposase [Sulfitobacter sp. SK011]AXI41778.1 IS5/IS1182 family transposase [Sulfitobacter sp. SK011]AXI42599.1 IS5/IS1182 family transposase [Sulfitobacter sp. SK011]